MKERINTTLDKLLAEKEPKIYAELVALAKTFQAEGQTQKSVYEAFLEVYVAKICVEGQVVVSDAIDDSFTNVLDVISGWCGSDHRLWP